MSANRVVAGAGAWRGKGTQQASHKVAVFVLPTTVDIFGTKKALDKREQIKDIVGGRRPKAIV